MKSSILLSGLFFSVLFLSITESHAQWQPDMRLTNDPATSQTSLNNAWSIAASDTFVHVVWIDNRDGNNEIYYKRSSDGGISWEADTRLTNNSAASYNPAISVTGQVVHVVWDDGNDEIYYKRSTDEGISWEADIQLTSNTDYSFNSSVSASGSVVHVVWLDYRDGNAEIYYKRSSDGGTGWGTDKRLTNDPAISGSPSSSVSGQVVHVIWCDNRGGDWEIYYKRSTDEGVSWGADTRLTNAPDNSWYPSVSVSGQYVHVVWMDLRDGQLWEIYYKRSADGGISWEGDIRLTNAPGNSRYPSVSVSSEVVHVAWDDLRDGNQEIYYKRSTDEGASWEADTRLTNNSASSVYPSVSVSAPVVHIVWTDNRDGNEEIYYKRDPAGNPTGVINLTGEIPKEYVLSQNYPNPFNPSTVIHYSLIENGFVTLKVYDVRGNEIATLVNGEQNPGNYNFQFSTVNYQLSSGIYYYKLEAGNFSEVRKMILLK